MHHMTRREFAAMVAAGTIAVREARPFAFSQGTTGGAVTAAELVDRIRRNIGVAWQDETVDTVKAGNPATRVTGVATTALASIAVLQQAVKAGANVVISSEPTFYSRADSPTPPAGRGRGRGAAGAPAGMGAGANQGAPTPPPDPVFAAKNELIARHGLVIFRLSDHWRLRTPDPFAAGFASLLGWTAHQSAADPRRFDLPASAATTLGDLATMLATGLRTRGGMRIIGDAATRVRRVGLLAGSTPIQASLAMLPHVDALVAGEVREWESVEYARDAVYSGQRKGVILLGRVVSEEPGMAACAEWIRTLVPEVEVRHLPAGDPYWRPA